MAVCLLMPLSSNAADNEQESVYESDNTLDLGQLSLDEIARELSNPVTSLASFKIDVEYRGYQGYLSGAGDQSTYIYNFQPSIPIPLDNGKNILMRASIPIWGNQPLYFVDRVEYPEYRVRQLADTLPRDKTFIDGHDHRADIELNLAYGGVSDNGLISMYGGALVLPTSSDISSAIDRYQIGPEIALGKIAPWGLYGVTAKHLSGVIGNGDYDYNMSTIELFFAYSMNNGWQLFSNPVIGYDWEAANDNKLFLPLGGGLAKTIRLGSVPVKLAFEAQYYVVNPDSFSPQWLLTFSMTPVFRNPFQK